MLQDQPHAAHIIPRIAPVPLGAQAAEQQFLLTAFVNGRRGAANLLGHEPFAAARRLVIVKDAVGDEQAEALPVNRSHLRSKGLRAAVGSDRPESLLFVLRNLVRAAEY